MYVSLKGFNVCKIYLTSVKKRNNLQSLVYITPIYFFHKNVYLPVSHQLKKLCSNSLQ